MKAWRQRSNQQVVKAEYIKAMDNEPRAVIPTRWGKITKRATANTRVGVLCSVLFVPLMMRGGWLSKEAMAKPA